MKVNHAEWSGQAYVTSPLAFQKSNHVYSNPILSQMRFDGIWWCMPTLTKVLMRFLGPPADCDFQKSPNELVPPSSPPHFIFFSSNWRNQAMKIPETTGHTHQAFSFSRRDYLPFSQTFPSIFLLSSNSQDVRILAK